jgi:hypothetical protein
VKLFKSTLSHKFDKLQTIKGTYALDRMSWSIKSVCNPGWKDVLKVEYNDPHKMASKLRGFPVTVQTNTVGHLWEANI